VYTSTAGENRKGKWIEYSKSIAVRLGKGPKYAQFLRRWERDWFDTRTPPPSPMRGRNVKRKSLFTDEGVSIIILLQEQFVIINRWFWQPENISTPLHGELLHPGFVPQLNLIFRARMHTA